MQNLEEEEIGRLVIGIMEGYKLDTVQPSLSDFLPSTEMGPRLPQTPHIARVLCTELPGMSEKGSSSRKRARNEVSAENESKQKERVRRENMTEKFYHLQSLVPSLKGINKATREMIVTDTINYIKFLEEEKDRLEGLKKSIAATKPALSHCTNMNSSINVTASNGVAFFGIQLPTKTSLTTNIFRVFHKHQAEVLTASVSVDEEQLLTLSATVVLENHGRDDIIEKIKREILML